VWSWQHEDHRLPSADATFCASSTYSILHFFLLRLRCELDFLVLFRQDFLNWFATANIFLPLGTADKARQTRAYTWHLFGARDAASTIEAATLTSSLDARRHAHAIAAPLGTDATFAVLVTF